MSIRLASIRTIISVSLAQFLPSSAAWSQTLPDPAGIVGLQVIPGDTVQLRFPVDMGQGSHHTSGGLEVLRIHSEVKVKMPVSYPEGGEALFLCSGTGEEYRLYVSQAKLDVVPDNQVDIRVIPEKEPGGLAAGVKSHSLGSSLEQPNQGNLQAAANRLGQVLLARKPVIYLYPLQQQETTVSLEFSGELTATYPEIDVPSRSWKVLSNPNGALSVNGESYDYLFWEAHIRHLRGIDWKSGFVIPGSETASFLRHSLNSLGLSARESGDFISYWLPLMNQNPYNQIYFAIEEYKKEVALNINPPPTTTIRVFMVEKKYPSSRR